MCGSSSPADPGEAPYARATPPLSPGIPAPASPPPLDPAVRRRLVFEVAAVAITGAAFLAAGGRSGGERIAFITVCLLAWTVHAVRQVRRDRGTLAAWGLGRTGLGPSARAAARFALPVLAGILIYRLLAGWKPLPPGALLLFVLYPVWALLQQILVQGIAAGNLRRLGVPPAVLVPVAALGFGLVHLPDLVLASLTAAAGAVWTAIFLRTGNLIPLALSHAWLGTLVYAWILERDPLGSMPGSNG